ncbi:mevalonate kinase [Candidatus Methanoplasma termitum]|uniref:mevalonate kinase n=1 Tax=Candidatus Methanoplasma termitum TaxID=1577791 RepID=A0A0A7LCQ8_9ARCH|nr:mevalonate kinase [Candidatus Methanoplasma termitum]AIZ56067.1 mevalonate kinase [Candidatus Methanoplasma termitum]MCL2333605.1 mevalonate kinase [Candidatus Methanoplasma sp.]
MNEAFASAPGKFVILGEHAVVYGKPAIAIAIDRRFYMSVKKSNEFMINNEAADIRQNPHLRYILGNYDMMPVSVNMDSRIPTGSGLGSSAALSVAFSAAMRALNNRSLNVADIAKEAFEAEYFSQGRGSPMDTSASAHGYGIALNMSKEKEDILWNISKNEHAWNVSRIDVPKMTFVIGCTGIRAATGPLVEKVRKYKDSNRFASDIIEEISGITVEGLKCIRSNDVVNLGKLMTKNHKLLSILGVSSDELNKLVNASLPYAYGAKLTGAGGGGCMVALTDQPDKVCEAISSRGGAPFIVKTGVEGVRTSEKSEQK